MGYITTSVKRLSNTSNSATYSCTVNFTGYYGVWSDNSGAAVKKYNSYSNYIGWPTYSNWKSSWGTPAWYLWHSGTRRGPFGTLTGELVPKTKTWTETVPIDRGTKRQGSREIEVGIVVTPNTNGQYYGTKKVTLYTTMIPDPTINNVEMATVDDNVVITVDWTNPEDYYSLELYSSDGKKVDKVSNSVFKITVDENNSGKKISASFKAIGKDGTSYTPNGSNSNIDINVEYKRVGVYAKDSPDYNLKKITFRNVNHKDVKEVLIKKDGKWRKTI